MSININIKPILMSTVEYGDNHFQLWKASQAFRENEDYMKQPDIYDNNSSQIEPNNKNYRCMKAITYFGVIISFIIIIYLIVFYPGFI